MTKKAKKRLVKTAARKAKRPTKRPVKKVTKKDPVYVLTVDDITPLACASGVVKFRKVFGEGGPINKANLMKADKKDMPIAWVLHRFCKPTAKGTGKSPLSYLDHNAYPRAKGKTSSERMANAALATIKKYGMNLPLYKGKAKKAAAEKYYYINARWLAPRACPDQVMQFRKVFGEGDVAINEANLLKAAQNYIAISWLVRKYSAKGVVNGRSSYETFVMKRDKLFAKGVSAVAATVQAVMHTIKVHGLRDLGAPR